MAGLLVVVAFPSCVLCLPPSPYHEGIDVPHCFVFLSPLPSNKGTDRPDAASFMDATMADSKQREDASPSPARDHLQTVRDNDRNLTLKKKKSGFLDTIRSKTVALFDFRKPLDTEK